jgi:deoxyadenosine/deoxycytidine kinase
MNNRHPDYIVVEGPIGVGKTTLAKRLAATFQTDLMLEMEDENPFLPRFYANQKSVALPTQLYFLFQRVRQIEMLRQKDMFKPVQVADFLIEKDKMFAHITLDDDELDLYQQVYARLTLDAPVPDLVIYLQAPVEVLMQRIIERGHEYERLIEKSYLQLVADAYVDFFYHYSTAPLLIVNTIYFDLANGIRDYNLLLEQIQHLKSGRHYFNPKEL